MHIYLYTDYIYMIDVYKYCYLTYWILCIRMQSSIRWPVLLIPWPPESVTFSPIQYQFPPHLEHV